MTIYYQTQSWSSQPQVTQDQIDAWKHFSQKKHWRIVEPPNGYYQTECKTLDTQGKATDTWHDVTRRETLDGAEKAIDGSIEHYQKRLDFISGPKVVKTFE